MTVSNYLSGFGKVSTLRREVLLNEIDRVWHELELDNSRRLSEQQEKVAAFYSHEVWILNGLFSEHDPVSRGHRKAIAELIANLPVLRVADYGGGSGALARFIVERKSTAYIDIIEPFPAQIFKIKAANFRNVNFVSELSQQYDLLVAQDVLEHVDDPIDLALKLIESVKINGYLIFANRFYPDISCHLPSTFYLRHQFKRVMKFAGLEFLTVVPGAKHALVFKKISVADHAAVFKANSFARVNGLLLNGFSTPLYHLKQIIKKYASR
jgi:2-polyprenyl-3-methyl-5-hydroxy-6-metoxy-1,4-benzoquinol methylase